MAASNGENCLRTVHDVLIVGAGPSGLAVAARLKERTPSALYTDEEHQRYHWLAKHGPRSSVKNRRNGRTKCASQDNANAGKLATLVVDSSSDKWMGKWHRLFAALELSHLRSPMFFHPDPRDRDALLAFAHAEGRGDELLEITGCVGKEISKHKKKKRADCSRCGTMRPTEIDERDRQDYFTPSTEVFNQFCQRMIGRYDLGHDLIVKETVTSIDFGHAGDNVQPIFTVKTNRTLHFARAVVMAVGPGEFPRIPAPFPSEACNNTIHAANLHPRKLIDHALAKKISQKCNTNVLVIGGGLTSAQIADAAIRSGVTKVWQVVRGQLRVKPFDVDLCWMGKFRNREKATFWMADDDEERAELLRQAIGGGSVTPRYHKILQGHKQSGRLALFTQTVVASQKKTESGQLIITTEPPVPSLPPIDFVYFATGMQGGIDNNPPLKAFHAKFPIDTMAGLPALTDDLMWKEDVPLFVTGKMAALRLGPGAGNLEGARAGAERVTLAVEALLSKSDDVSKEEREALDDSQATYRYAWGLGSRFEALESGD